MLQDADHATGRERMCDLGRQALMHVFVDHSQKLQSMPVLGLVGKMVLRPDLVLLLYPTRHTAMLTVT